MRILVLLLLVAPSFAQDILVIAPKDYHEALQPWIAHRSAQGHEIAIAEPGEDPRPVVQAVAKSSDGKLRFVLLVGDVKQVPAHFYDAIVIKKWEKNPRVASDNRTADLDGDHIPDVAIGRMPADSPADAKLMLGKVIEYENNRDFTSWRRRVNVVASVGGFGAMQDRAIETAATMFLKQNVPAAYDMHVTYGKPDSPFCPPPSKIMATTLERFNEGSLFVAYIGHGHKLGFDRVRFQKQSWDIFEEDNAYEIKARHGMPIAFLLCCTTGHFDGAPDCIAEIMVRQPKGPVAVIASSRVSMPYGNAPLAKELLEAVFLERKATLGEAFLQAKVRSITPKAGDQQRAQIEFLSNIYEADAAKRKQERIEHLYLYNLIGDPSMRIPHPEVAKLKLPDQAAAGALVEIEIEAPIGGRYTVDVLQERTPGLPGRKNDTDAEFERVYKRSNNWVRATTSGTAEAGTFKVKVQLPERLVATTYDVRIWIENDKGAALGNGRLKIRN